MTKNQPFHLTIIEPQNYPASATFIELAETVLHGLIAIGVNATYATNTTCSDAINIIFGAHLLSQEQSTSLPTNTIIYNTEQISPESQFKNSPLLELIKKFETWDYSLRNIERLAEKGITANIHHVPIGFVTPLCRIPKAAHQDIDVLFYGIVNERRQKILQALIDHGLNVVSVIFCYGEERDDLISRAKVVLNLHYYESKIFEMVRVSYLLSNRKAVVAEVDDETDIDPTFYSAVAGVPYEQLVDTCIQLVNNEKKRNELEQRGFEIMASHPEEVYLQKCLISASAKYTMALSILVCSTNNRFDSFLPNIMQKLNNQVKYFDDVEVITLIDNKKIILGEKRNHLVNMATGNYVVFVDDDDDITEDYIEQIYAGTKSNADVVTFKVNVSLNGGEYKLCHYNAEYIEDYNQLNPAGEIKSYHRLPNHIMAIKRSLCLQAPYKPILRGEDSIFSKEIKPLIKSQYHIDKVLYFYLFNQETSETSETLKISKLQMR